MELISSDNKKNVDVGDYGTWNAVRSTVLVLLKKNVNNVPQAVQFLQNASCNTEVAIETARQFNLIRDALAAFPPEKAVYDIDNPKAVAPWKNNLSPVITSCANLFTTADGKDLLFEIVSILTYAGYTKTSVLVEG